MFHQYRGLIIGNMANTVSCAVDIVASANISAIYEADHPTSLSDSLGPEPMTYYAHFSVYMCNYGISMVGEKMS